MFLLAMLAAAQAAAPATATPPAAHPAQRTVIREVIITRDGKATESAAKNKKEERREVIVIRDGKEGASAARPDHRIRIVDVAPRKGEERREVRILREPGTPGTRVAMLSCDDGAKVDSEATDKDGKKTRVMICAKGGNQIAALESASKRIADNKDIPNDVRQRILSQVDAEIARLKATN